MTAPLEAAWAPPGGIQRLLEVRLPLRLQCRVRTGCIRDRAALPEQRKHCRHVDQALLGLAVHGAQDGEG